MFERFEKSAERYEQVKHTKSRLGLLQPPPTDEVNSREKAEFVVEGGRANRQTRKYKQLPNVCTGVTRPQGSKPYKKKHTKKASHDEMIEAANIDFRNILVPEY